jgi:branched-chain amino acid aminotransferase
MHSVCFNGKFLAAEAPLFTAQNRGFRYGDGLFETLKVHQEQILFGSFHFERLLLGIKMLQMETTYTEQDLSQMVMELCRKNDCAGSARVRLACFRNEQNKADYVIEAFPLPEEVNQWNEKGLTIDLYPYARKNPDSFSNLKTANFLPYVLAGLFAKEKALDDAIVLNAFNKLADSSKANIFLIRNGEIFTPALHQGCVSGVIRRFLLDALKKSDYRIHLDELSEEDLGTADEVFLTNSIQDIRWVKRFREKEYASTDSRLIYEKIIAPLY